ncbi:MAG: glycoside hydrolase family 15 protein [Actinomycetota bacterium]
MGDRPIGDYGLISDCHSAALVSRDGSIDWLCFPRFDAPSVFGRLLDENAGYFSIRPRNDATSTRRYIEETMVLETTFDQDGGTLVLTDALAVGDNERGHDLGAQSPHFLVRRIDCTRGTVAVDVAFAPRPEYGLIEPLLQRMDLGIRARGGAGVLFLCTPLHLEIDGATARAEIELNAGDSMTFAVQYHSTSAPPPEWWTEEDATRRLDDTITAWQTWSSHHQAYEGPWRDLINISGRVLQALTYQPTGAIVAATTTSLPEEVGGERNWDYRYAWVRDASLTVEALWVAACPDEVDHFFDYLTGAASAQLRSGADLQIMFGIGGEHDLTERELPHLSGWRNSRPVRVGNGAWSQRQLDVYGELLNTVYRLSDQFEQLDDATKSFFVDVADTAAARWEERDQGIWEVRGDPQPFLYSKLMCWVALERAISMADRFGAEERVDGWTQIRDRIADAILQHGWNEKAGAFTQAFGSEDLDASALMVPIVGFLPGTDHRVVSTVDAIEERLTDKHGLVFRYLAPDGLEGEEGTFLLCTFWLAHAQALAGEVTKARATFENAIGFVNDLGLLAEEVDPETRELLGNFPQAFSHIGLVNAAWAISQAEKGLSPGGSPLRT